MDNLYLYDGENKATQFKSQKYEQEMELQKIITENPFFLCRSTDPNDLKFFLVSEEQPLESEREGSLNRVDHLFIDSDGVPVLVEIKRSTDHRIHREVMGQMIDYASHVRFLDIQYIREKICSNADFQGTKDTSEYDAFFLKVDENLKRERIKLVFVSDSIPPTLKNMILFMDDKSMDMDFYGVELQKYTVNGQSVLSKTLVENITNVPIKTKETQTECTWEILGKRVEEISGTKTKDGLQKLLDFCKRRNIEITWGTGSVYYNFVLYLNNLSFVRVETLKKKVNLDFDPVRMEKILKGAISASEIEKELYALKEISPEFITKFADDNIKINAKYLENHVDDLIALLEMWLEPKIHRK